MKALTITILTLSVLFLTPSQSITPEFKYLTKVIHKLNTSIKWPVIKKQPVSRGMDKHYIGTFETTAYNLTQNKTTSGTRTRVGVVAVDPRVIPLGTKLYIEGYGYAIAEDTGAAIKGRIIDVWLPGDEAWEWGRRQVKVWRLIS